MHLAFTGTNNNLRLQSAYMINWFLLLIFNLNFFSLMFIADLKMYLQEYVP